MVLCYMNTEELAGVDQFSTCVLLIVIGLGPIDLHRCVLCEFADNSFCGHEVIDL